jgi:hypothetical protein
LPGAPFVLLRCTGHCGTGAGDRAFDPTDPALREQAQKLIIVES